MKDATRSRLKLLRDYVDGDADTAYEYIMLAIIFVNTVSIGLETSEGIFSRYGDILIWIGRICFFFFLAELVFKAIVYNKDFCGEERKDEKGRPFYFINWWNISDLLIVIVSAIPELSFGGVFRMFRFFKAAKLLRSAKFLKAVRSFRVLRVFKFVNEFSSLRSIFRGLVRAVPGIFATFCFLAVFAYVYGVIGTCVFIDERCSEYFGDLGKSVLTLCQLLTMDSWFSGVTRGIMKVYPWAWIYFVSYVFIAALVIMNVIVGIIVDSIAKERDLQRDDKTEVTLERFSEQIAELKKTIELHEERYEEYIAKTSSSGLLGLVRKAPDGKPSAPSSSMCSWRSAP